MTVDVVTKSHSSAGIGVTITASHTAMQVSKRFLRVSYSIELLLLSVAWHYAEGLKMQTCHNWWPGLRHKCTTSSKNWSCLQSVNPPAVQSTQLKVIRKFFLNHNKSFRWHLGDYEKYFFSIWRPVRWETLFRKNTQKSKFLLSQAFKWKKKLCFL